MGVTTQLEKDYHLNSLTMHFQHANSHSAESVSSSCRKKREAIAIKVEAEREVSTSVYFRIQFSQGGGEKYHFLYAASFMQTLSQASLH